MDPITQISIGAAVAVAISPKDQTRLAAFLGAVAGGAPDLDVLIRSSADPLLSLQYHRHFTHALIMAPVIGFCIAVVFKLLLFRSTVPLKKFVLYAAAGALTHGPIDACTSYGTLLYWPFSSHRESWDLISIIDPIFTLPLVALTLLAIRRGQPLFARIAVALCVTYLSFCGFQHMRAKEVAQEIAAESNHYPDVYSVRPSLANNLLWRTIYEFNGRYYVNAVWVVPGKEPVVYPGRSVNVFSTEDAADLALPDSVLGRDIERFRYFSQGYVYRHPNHENVLGDLRYAIYPDSTLPLWGIHFDLMETESHAEMEYFRDITKSSLLRLWKMICGQQVEAIRD